MTWKLTVKNREPSVPGNIARGLSTNLACEVSAITEGNITGRD